MRTLSANPNGSAEFDALPRRVFLAGARNPRTDDYGFVQPLPSDEVLGATELLAQAAALVVAPPWTGKTFVAEQLENALKTCPELPPSLRIFGERVHRVCFEEHGRPLKPAWWGGWKGRACWIIDALDEDERQGGSRLGEILGLLEALPGSALARLHVLFFCRLNEIPPGFERRAGKLFGEWSPQAPQGLRRLRLAGLDREAARTLVGAGRFEHVCRLIEVNDLKTLACLPVVLENLKARDPDASVDRQDLWRGVLMDLLRERRRPRGTLFAQADFEIEDCFEVVQWLAAALTFSGQTEIGIDSPGSSPSSLEGLIPRDLPGRDGRILRQAAREAVRTAVFERTDRGSYRFAQDHVRQWLAAFAVKDMPLAAIQPLLTDGEGKPNPAHEGIMDLLVRIARDTELRDWIDRAHGGVLPPSGMVPWSTDEAIGALDRLQELAHSSPWGLALWHEERLSQLTTPGLGAELARRLEGQLSVAEQELLLDVAVAIEAPEPLGAAVHILRDEAQDGRIRALAADYFVKLAGREQLEPLEPWVRSPLDKSPDAHGIFPILASGFFQKGIWDFETTAGFALSHSDHDWLQARLADELTTDRARALLRSKAPGESDLPRQPLVRQAIEKLLEAPPFEEDWDLLVPLAFQAEEPELDRSVTRHLVSAFERAPAVARRKLFLAGLAADPEDQLPESWRWQTVLDGEDTAWLLDVVLDRHGEPPRLWDTVHYLAYLGGAERSSRLRVRKEIRQRSPDLLVRLDQERKRWRSKKKRWDRRDRKEPTPTYELGPLVRETLDHPELDLHEKMLHLSWYCFTKPARRPTNLSGTWGDLETELQVEVKALCRKALARCLPTAIPEGSVYPTAVEWEAECFARMLEESSRFALSPKLIRNWLPGVLRTWEDDKNELIRRCFDVSRELSEDLVAEAILREIRWTKNHSCLAQSLIPELWSQRLTALLETEVIRKEDAPLSARIDLLRRVSRIDPARAGSIAKLWADDPAGATPNARSLRDAGINTLLAVDPVEGWARLKERMGDEGTVPVLLRMSSLHPHHLGPDAQFASWPAPLLEQLAACLYETFPPEADPHHERGQVYSPDQEWELRFLRVHIPVLLSHRNGEGDAEALERLAQKFPAVRLRLQQSRAQAGAEAVLVGLGQSQTSTIRHAVPVSEVVRLLQDPRSRLLRTTDDLQAVVLEQLKAIAVDARKHLSMLYMPPKDGKRRHLHEEALQSYLQCRLSDRLSSGILEPHPQVVFLDRETLAARNTRNDLKIQATSFDGQPLTLIVEVKWSDNDEISIGQVEQLGLGYLGENGWTHGIYLVGWCGKGSWKPAALGTGPSSKSSLEAWKASLEGQAQLCCQEHPELKLEICPLILDLTWEASEPHSG